MHVGLGARGWVSAEFAIHMFTGIQEFIDVAETTTSQGLCNFQTSCNGPTPA